MTAHASTVRPSPSEQYLLRSTRITNSAEQGRIVASSEADDAPGWAMEKARMFEPSLSGLMARSGDGCALSLRTVGST